MRNFRYRNYFRARRFRPGRVVRVGNLRGVRSRRLRHRRRR